MSGNGNGRKGKRPGPQDWHLWSEVTRSVSPLPRRKSLRRKAVSAVETVGGKAVEGGGVVGANVSSPSFPESEKQVARDVFWSPAFSSRGTGNAQASSRAVPSGIEPRIHRRMRRGRVPIDASIDLHGLHQHEARAALYRFVQARARAGDRTLLVITGKGLKKTGHGSIEQKGVLRYMLPHWLADHAIAHMIAGYEVSARHHGGEGAYYVRLRRNLQ